MSFVVEISLFLAAGLAGGLLLGLIGVGMALIAVPLLTQALPAFGIDAATAPKVALATSMAIVAIGSISSIISHHRLGNVDWRTVRTIVPASLVGVVVGTLVVSYLPGGALRWIFSSFLCAIAVRMLLPAKKTNGRKVAAPTATLLRFAGAAIGVAGSLIGAGGGVFMVPFLNGRGYPMAKSVATSTTIGFPVSACGAILYALHGPVVSKPGMVGFIFLPAFLGLAVGSVLSAPAGAKLASRVNADVLRKGFAILLIVLAAKMVLG